MVIWSNVMFGLLGVATEADIDMLHSFLLYYPVGIGQVGYILAPFETFNGRRQEGVPIVARQLQIEDSGGNLKKVHGHLNLIQSWP